MLDSGEALVDILVALRPAIAMDPQIAGDTGWQIYEFVRAQARLRTLNGAAPDDVTRDLVLEDARIAMTRPSIKKIIESAPPSNGRDVVGTIRSYLDERPQVRVSTKPES